MKWRRWNNIIHRDLGYLCFGLTIIYAVSGLAVNHIHDWNPNYSIETVHSSIGSFDSQALSDSELIAGILERLGEESPVKNYFRPGPEKLQIFLEKNTVTVNLQTGEAVHQKFSPRPALYAMNFLHLNHPKKAWTIVADIYAVLLGVMAVTGLFVLGGRKGITGRGAWLTTAGILLPLIFLFLYMQP